MARISTQPRNFANPDTPSWIKLLKLNPRRSMQRADPADQI